MDRQKYLERKRLDRRRAYAANPDKFKEKWALYRARYPDKIKLATARYIAKNKTAISEREKQRWSELRLQVVVAYGGKCSCCGEAEPKFLCIDHVNGDGKLDRQRGYSGVHLFAKLRREGYPKAGYRLLCHNCNEAIRIVGVCPHKLSGAM